MSKQPLDLAIVGLGVTDQGRIEGATPEQMRIEGLRRAIADARVSPRDVDGYIYQQGSIDIRAFAPGGRVPKALGMAPKTILTLQGGGTSAIAGIASAAGLIAAGACELVAVGYGDAMLSYKDPTNAGRGRQEPTTSSAYGLFTPADDHAMSARRHMHEYGTTKEQLGEVALAARSYATLRSDAYMHGRELTMDDYLNARMVAEPLGKFDCCLLADGGSAFLVTTWERAKDMTDTPVRVAGMGFSHTIASGYDYTQYRRSNISEAKDDAFGRAGISIDDVDVAQIYDCFTIEVLTALEGLGFCGEGEAGPWVEAGNLRLDAPTPVNTAGGELAWSYMQGFTPVVEGLRQLRGESGPTQVAGAKTTVITGHGMTAPGAGNAEYGDAVMVLTTEG